MAATRIHLPAGMLNFDWLTSVITLGYDNTLIFIPPVPGLRGNVSY